MGAIQDSKQATATSSTTPWDMGPLCPSPLRCGPPSVLVVRQHLAMECRLMVMPLRAASAFMFLLRQSKTSRVTSKLSSGTPLSSSAAEVLSECVQYRGPVPLLIANIDVGHECPSEMRPRIRGLHLSPTIMYVNRCQASSLSASYSGAILGLGFRVWGSGFSCRVGVQGSMSGLGLGYRLSVAVVEL